jgi:thiol-disulfide isomerase/thioredoxin
MTLKQTLVSTMAAAWLAGPIPTLAALPVEGAMPSLAGATAWLGSPPLSTAELRGKVVLLDVWTYTCINWLRTLPYVRAWASKYKDHGLVVIGVHAPEFSFEREAGNVRRAVLDMQIAYPVAIDNDFAIWNALNNRYWPALYIVDTQGRIRYQHFGEGDYEASERAIQQLLREAGSRTFDPSPVRTDAQGLEAPPAWSDLKSPENYLGYGRTQGFSSSAGVLRDKARPYAVPGRLRINHWALGGNWTMTKEAVVSNRPNARIAYRFHARDLHLVMGPGSGSEPVRFRVLIDGKPPGPAHGTDIDEHGAGTVNAQRLYQLIRQPSPIAERTVEIEFLDPGAEAYAFTFG